MRNISNPYIRHKKKTRAVQRKISRKHLTNRLRGGYPRGEARWKVIGQTANGVIGMSDYPDWVEDRFGDDIPDWAEDRWGDDDDGNDDDDDDD